MERRVPQDQRQDGRRPDLRLPQHDPATAADRRRRQDDDWALAWAWAGADPMVNVTSRNNILHVTRSRSQSQTGRPARRLRLRSLHGHAPIRRGTGEPRDQGRADLRRRQRSEGRPEADSQLAPASPGYDAGLRLPNFNDGFTGQARTSAPRGGHAADGVRRGCVQEDRERTRPDDDEGFLAPTASAGVDWDAGCGRTSCRLRRPSHGLARRTRFTVTSGVGVPTATALGSHGRAAMARMCWRSRSRLGVDRGGSACYRTCGMGAAGFYGSDEMLPDRCTGAGGACQACGLRFRRGSATGPLGLVADAEEEIARPCGSPRRRCRSGRTRRSSGRSWGPRPA